MNLRDMNVGDKGKVTGFRGGASAYRKRLLAMGLVKGTEFVITRVAPLGDPVEISMRGFSLILRKNEADILEVEKINT